MDKKFNVETTSLPGLLLITPRILADSRGFYIETWNEADFAEYGIKDHFIQDYYTRSQKNVLRGLHCQWPPKATAKIVRCGAGEVWDVVVDLRPSSPTFKKWQTFILSAENRNALYIPLGLVHGFYATSEYAETCYKVTAYFDKEHDGGIRWNDPEIGITWPKQDPILSEKDKNLPLLKDLPSSRLAW